MSYDLQITNQLKMIKTIYYLLFSGMLLFFIIAVIYTRSNEAEIEKYPDKVLMLIVPLFGLLTMLISRTLYSRMISNYSTETDVLKKIIRYRTAKIVSWAMIESVYFLALIATILTSNYLYVVVAIFLFGYFFMLKPSGKSLMLDKHLNSDVSDKILKS